MKCKKCKKELTDKNRGDTSGFAGYCIDCEKEILAKENGEKFCGR